MAGILPFEEPEADPRADRDRRGIVARLVEGARGGFGTAPLGITPENQYRYGLMPLQPFVAPLDFLLRAPGAAIGGAAGGGAGLYEYVTGDRTGADRLQRDLGVLGQSAAISVAAPRSTAMPARSPPPPRLLMDEASRMARQRELGYADEPFYRGEASGVLPRSYPSGAHFSRDQDYARGFAH